MKYISKYRGITKDILRLVWVAAFVPSRLAHNSKNFVHFAVDTLAKPPSVCRIHYSWIGKGANDIIPSLELLDLIDKLRSELYQTAIEDKYFNIELFTAKDIVILSSRPNCNPIPAKGKTPKYSIYIIHNSVLFFSDQIQSKTNVGKGKPLKTNNKVQSLRRARTQRKLFVPGDDKGNSLKVFSLY